MENYKNNLIVVIRNLSSNNQFIENKIIRLDYSQSSEYVINIPKGLLKKGTNTITLMVIHNSQEGIMDGDIKSICDALLSENQLAMLSQLEEE